MKIPGFNRLRWFNEALALRGDAGMSDLVTALAHLADADGVVTQVQVEDHYGLVPGCLDDFFSGSDSILLGLPSRSETGG